MVYKTYLYYYNFFFNYPTPANLTNVWNFGILSFFFLLIQIASGIGLSMYYVPNEILAYDYVEVIMRDTYFGWFFRYVHSNGASLFFFFVYLHMFRSLYYMCFINPKDSIWNTGVIILILMIVTAFTGYVLPWGQMSFWAATVITNLITAIPFLGPEAAVVIWGSHGVSTITLNRFYTAHFFLPFVILLIMIIHFFYLHSVGSSNGVGISQIEDKMKFHPYYTWKDIVVLITIISLYIFIIMVTPNYLSHEDNYIPAEMYATPEHIVPEWYFLAFYAILRSIPNKIGGILVMGMSLIILFGYPSSAKKYYNIDMWNISKREFANNWSVEFFILATKRTNPVLMKYLFWIFVMDFVGLSYIGMKPVEYPYSSWGIYLTIVYFCYFLFVSYTHQYLEYIIFLKHVYIPYNVLAIRMVGQFIRFLYRSFLKILNYLSPVLHDKLVFYLKIIINIIFFKKYDVLKKFIFDILDKVEKWGYDFEKGYVTWHGPLDQKGNSEQKEGPFYNMSPEELKRMAKELKKTGSVTWKKKI